MLPKYSAYTACPHKWSLWLTTPSNVPNWMLSKGPPISPVKKVEGHLWVTRLYILEVQVVLKLGIENFEGPQCF